MLHRLRKLLSLDRHGWRDLIRAQGALLRAQRRLRSEPLGGLAERQPAVSVRATGDTERAQSLALAVRRAARHGLFRPYCLVQAMALQELLQRDGISGASIRVGVRRVEGRFEAHAWIRWGEGVLGDDPDHVARFTEVDDLRVLDRR